MSARNSAFVDFFAIILTILTIIGSLGLFLYGMILMSESLQKAAGKRIRKALSAVSANNFRGIITGTLITGTIQSSSATTVLVVSFVNAGLLSLVESFGLIMGANIGTTVTPWIISLLGFGKTFDINIILLPLIALSLPLLFSGRSSRKQWAEFILGFAILFMGLQFLKNSIPVLDEANPFVQNIKELGSSSFSSILLFIGIGTILTILFQSSTAVMAFTFVIASDGWISFELAAAMVLGENIGTTVTANFAAIVANTTAKRTAFFHFLFNITGVVWVVIFFKPILYGIDLLTIEATGLTAYENMDPVAITFSLAVFHTAFNIVNTIIFSIFLRQIAKFIIWLLPCRHKEKDKFHLKHINSAYLSTAELSIVQAKKELINFGEINFKMFELIPQLLHEKRQKKYKKILETIQTYESLSDEMEIEIARFLTKLSEEKLSMKANRQVKSMLRIIDELESIADSCYNISNTIENKNYGNHYFIQEQRNNIFNIYGLVREALEIMITNLGNDYDEVQVGHAVKLEKKINESKSIIRTEHIQNLNEDKYNYQTGVYYIDIIAQLEMIGDFALNITEAIVDSQNH